MTEEEAKTKWCPMVRFDPEGGINRESPNLVFTCIASCCMMWIWDSHNTHTLKDGKVADGYGNMQDALGHCGLAK